MPSEIAGTAFLFAILVISAFIAFLNRRDPPDPKGILPLAGLTLAIQAVHCAEKFVTGPAAGGGWGSVGDGLRRQTA